MDIAEAFSTAIESILYIITLIFSTLWDISPILTIIIGLFLVFKTQKRTG